MFAEINLLVLEGDAAGLAAKVSELSAVREVLGSQAPAENGNPRATPVPLIHSGDS
jgi:hypothetical protein